MSKGLALLASSPVVIAGMGSLAVAVAAVVVVLAIVAVVVMVLRNNGAGRQAAGGLGYDARRGARDDYGDYNAPPPPWGRQAGGAQQPGAWQNGGNGGPGYGGPGGPNSQAPMGGRNSGANWGQGQGEAPAAPAWGGGAAGEPARAWANAGPAVNSMPRGQAQQPWDAPAPDAGPPAWGGDQGWNNGPAQQSAGPGAWGQADAQATPAWGGQQQATPQPGGPWGGSAAAPDQNAWGVPSPASVPPANAWGIPAAAPQPAAPQQGAQNGQNGQNAWGAAGSPSGANWGSPQPMPAGPPTQPWGGPGAQNGYDAPPPAAYGGMNGMDRGRAGTNLRPGAIVVKEGKEPGRVFEIRGNRLTIGRSRDSDIFLEDLAVSRLHATVNRDPSGQYFVRDEGSANGTTVNGQRVTEQRLEEGDEISLGQTVLTFVRH